MTQKKFKEKALSLLLVLALCLGLIPNLANTAYAAGSLEPVAAGTGAIRDYLDNQALSKASTYYDYVYYGGLKWRVLDTEADSGNGTGVLLFSDSVLNYGQAWNGYRINSDREGSDTTKGYLNSDIRKYLNGAETYTSFRTGRSISNDEVPYLYVNNMYYFREEIKEGLSTFSAGPLSGVTYYVVDNEDYRQETQALTESTFAQGAYYTQSGGKFERATTYSSSETYYYDASTYKVWSGSAFENGKTYYRFHVVTGVPTATALPSAIIGTIYYVGYKINPSRVISGMDAADVNFVKDNGISAIEKAAVLSATKTEPASNASYYAGDYRYYGGSMDGDSYFLLSAKEANNPEYGMNYQANRRGSAHWWLRSSHSYYIAGYVNSGGTFYYGYATTTFMGVRPAFYLNPTSVLFASESSAAGGKSGAVGAPANFSKIASSETQNWKLTMLDTSLSVTPGTATESGGTITLPYSAASTYGSDVYLSAIITNGSGNQIYGYAKLAAIDSAAKQSGTVTMTLPTATVNGTSTQLTMDNCKVKVFLERCGGATETDYASQPQEINTPDCSSHEYGEWVYPSGFDCTVGGTRTHTCVFCGHEESETVTAVDHDLHHHEKVEKDCLNGNGGVEEYWECTVCGKLFADEDATIGVGSVNELLINETHDRVTRYYPANTSNVASQYPDIVNSYHYSKIECATCNTVILNYQARNYWAKHEGVDCEHGGTCTVCGQVLTEGPGHTYNVYDTSTFAGYKEGYEPTCEEEGIGIYKCLVCGEYGEYPVAALGHLWTPVTTVLDPTYTTVGGTYRSCSRCGASESDPVAVLEREDATIVISGPSSFLNTSGAPVSVSEDGSTTFNFTHCDGDGNSTGMKSGGVNYNATITWLDSSGNELGGAPSNPGTYTLKVSANIANSTETKANGTLANAVQIPVHSYNEATGTLTFTIEQPSGDNDILTFVVDGQEGQSAINYSSATVTVTMPWDTSDAVLSSLKPSSVTVSDNAEITDPSDYLTAEKDYTGGIVYKVKAQNGNVKNWTITVVRGAVPTPTVSFETGGVATIPSQTVTLNQAYGTLPTVENDLYVFEGWYLNSDYSGNEVTASTIVTTSADHTLYAKLRALKLIVPSAQTPQTAEYDGTAKTFEPKALVSGTTDEYVTDGFTVYYKPEGANESEYVTEAPSDYGTYDVKYTRVKDDTYLAMTPDGTGKLIIDSSTRYTVKYSDGANGEVFAEQSYEAKPDTVTPFFDTTGLTLDANGNPARDGYVFDTWAPDFAIKVTGNVTYTAQWKQDENNDDIPDERQIFVKYVSEDDAKGTLTGETTQVFTAAVKGDWVTVSTVAVGNAPAQGYVFDNFTNDHDQDKVSVSGIFHFGAMQANGQTITVTGHFEEDTNNDLTPDKYQVFVNYVSEDDTKGTLSGTVSEVFTAEKNTDGTYKETVSFTAKAVATINAVDGFAFDKWTEDYSDRSNTTGIFKFNTVPVGETITITASFLEDENGDDIPDKYQVFVNFVSDDTSKGSVSGETAQVFTANQDSTTGEYASVVNFTTGAVTATPEDGYAFEKWANSYNSDVRTAVNGTFTMNGVAVGTEITVTAYFEDDGNNDDIPDQHQVTVKFESSDSAAGSVSGEIEQVFTAEQNADGTYKETVSFTTRSVTAAAEDGYVFYNWSNGYNSDKIYAEDGTFTFNGVPAGTVITVTANFEADENGDDIPDKYQVFVNYVSEDDTKGKLSGTTEEVFSAEKNADGSYKETVSFTAKAVATITPENGYTFDTWTEDYSNTSKASGIFTLNGVPVGTTVTVTASFDADENGDEIPDKYQVVVVYTVDDETKAEITGIKTEVFTADKNADGSYKDTVKVTTSGSEAKSIVSDPSVALKFWMNDRTSERNQKGAFNIGLVSAGETVTVTAVFSEDALGPDIDGDDQPDPDGVPDEYQVFVQYVAGAGGTVTGTRLYTFEELDEDTNTYSKYVSVDLMPEADLTATPNDGYIFGKWTNDKNSDTSKDGAFDLGVQKTGQTITVTANFIKITYVVEDTSGNSITPKTEVTDPKEGALIEDANGNKWIVRKITDPDEDGVAKVIVEAYSYFFAEGDGQNWTKGSAKALDFTVKRTVDDSTSYSHFTGLKIDGKTVAASQYSAQSGSVKLTLSSTLLETLSVGEHTLTAVFDDGEAEAKFTVVAKSDGNNNDNNNNNQNNNNQNNRINSPKTGDESNMLLWGSLSVLSLLCLIGVLYALKRHKKHE